MTWQLKEAVLALCSRGACEVAHSGRTLLVHLAGTHNILKSWGLSDDVALAGLYHSVYGRTYLPFLLFQAEERSEVRRLIGMNAEQMVWSYSSLDQRWWLNPPQFDRGSLHRQLAAIASANLVELESSPIAEIRTVAHARRRELHERCSRALGTIPLES